jgi:Domain of unknown function (DUF4406)
MLYLAGKMRGLPGLNHAAFAEGAAALRAAGHTVFNPAENGLSASNDDVRRFLAVDLAWIAGCAEGIIVLPGWEDSRGARAEVALAHAIEIGVWTLHEFLYGDVRPAKAGDVMERHTRGRARYSRPQAASTIRNGTEVSPYAYGDQTGMPEAGVRARIAAIRAIVEARPRCDTCGCPHAWCDCPGGG